MDFNKSTNQHSFSPIHISHPKTFLTRSCNFPSSKVVFSRVSAGGLACFGGSAGGPAASQEARLKGLVKLKLNQTHTIRSCLPAWGLLFQTELCFVGISWVWPIDLYNMYFYAAKYIAFIPIHACMLKIPSLSRIFRASLQRRLFLGGGQSFFGGHLIHELSFQRAVVKKIL